MKPLWQCCPFWIDFISPGYKFQEAILLQVHLPHRLGRTQGEAKEIAFER